MVFSNPTASSPYPMMRIVLPCVALIFISISVMFFYGNILSHQCPNPASESSSVKRPPIEPFTLSMPPCNCNCTVFYKQSLQPQEPSTPSLFCNCLERNKMDPNVTLACPKPLDPEVRIVEREVVKEVVQECPVCSAAPAQEVQIVEKEVIKEVAQECPVCPAAPAQEVQIVEKEIIKEVAQECPVCPAQELQIVEKEVIKEVEKKNCPRVPWHAEGKNWHYPASLPLCSMDSCFDFSRCDNAEELLIYTYYEPFPPKRYLQFINESKYHTDDPAKACLFLVPFENHTQHADKLPYWNGGLNHVVLSFSDKFGRNAPADDRLANASILASDMQETMFRPGFDISIPLPGKFHMRNYQEINSLERKYLATFRGLRYLGYIDDGNFRSKKEFRDLHNGKDIIVATTCEHSSNNWKRSVYPELGEGCDEDKALWSKYNFIDLMNTTFALVPAGRQPSSYRFIEVLSAGAIPVLIADNYVRPFDTLIPWYTCLIQFPTTEMHRIVPTLRAVKPQEILKRQKNCLQIYNEYLKDDETLFRSTIRALKARFLGALPNLTEVRRRR